MVHVVPELILAANANNLAEVRVLQNRLLFKADYLIVCRFFWCHLCLIFVFIFFSIMLYLRFRRWIQGAARCGFRLQSPSDAYSWLVRYTLFNSHLLESANGAAVLAYPVTY